MTINTTISRSMFRQLFAPFLVAVGLLTILFVMAEMIRITNWVVNYGIGLSVVLSLLLLMIPSFLVYILPMAVLLAVLLTFLRMSGDNEIVALKACGASIYALLPSVLAFCLLMCTLTLALTIWGVPLGRTAFSDLAFKVLTSRVDIGLKERTFNDALDKVVLYVGEIDPKNRRWKDIFIEDKRQPEAVNTVIAPEGQLFPDPDSAVLVLKLSNGTIHQTNLKERRSQAIHFTSYQLSFNLKESAAFNRERSKSTKELSLFQLRQELEGLTPQHARYHKTRTMMHRMIALPFACFSLGLLAMPLGIQSRSANRSVGLVLSLICILLYYLLLTAGYALGEKGRIPSSVAMWFPNLVIGALGLFFLIQTARERVALTTYLVRRIQRLAEAIGGGRRT
jgi:lipopolysaccharide export system permease protein